MNRSTYEFHLEHIKLLVALAAGDRDYLAAQLATGPERDRLAKSAAEHYRKSLQQSEFMLVRYHIDDQFVPMLFPPGTSRLNMPPDKVPPSMYRQILLRNRQLISQAPYDMHQEDRVEYERYADRSMMRLEQLEKGGATTRQLGEPASTNP